MKKILVALLLAVIGGAVYAFIEAPKKIDKLCSSCKEQGRQEGVAKGFDSGLTKGIAWSMAKQKRKDDSLAAVEAQRLEAARTTAKNRKKAAPPPAGYVMKGDFVAHDANGNPIPYKAAPQAPAATGAEK